MAKKQFSIKMNYERVYVQQIIPITTTGISNREIVVVRNGRIYQIAEEGIGKETFFKRSEGISLGQVREAIVKVLCFAERENDPHYKGYMLLAKRLTKFKAGLKLFARAISDLDIREAAWKLGKGKGWGMSEEQYLEIVRSKGYTI